VPDVNCPNCDESIEIEPDWYGRKVACPSCGERFVPRRPGEDAEDPPARPRKKVVVDDDEEDEDDRPRPKRKKRPEPPRPVGRGTKQLILVVAILGPILLMCLGCGGWVAFQLFGPMNYSAPWVNVATPDGAFAVQFPRSPEQENDTNAVLGGRGPSYVLSEDLPADAVFVFACVDDSHLGFDDAYRAEIDGIMREVKSEGAKLQEEKAVTSAGCRGKEAVITSKTAKVVFRFLDASERGRRRYLIVMAGGRNVSDADRTKFLDSLTRGR
jgi:hypothetical protein